MQEKKSLKNLKIKKLSVVGVIPSFAFQRAKYCALELHRKLPQRFPLPDIVGLLELDWSEKLQEWRQTLGREYWCLRRPVAVFFDDRFIGSDIELIKLLSIGNILMDNIPRKNMSSMKKHFRQDYVSYLRKSKRIYCYLDICVDGVYAGTLTFQLYSDILPRTCENFKTLCLGSRGPLLSYRGSRIHRIVKKGWLQGGDIQYKSGGGGFSIFCDPLEDECFGISHDRRGVLSMASGERHANGSQFFITLQPSKWMDTHFVAFGQLVEGVQVLRILENLETFYECPLKKVEIKSCGKLDLQDVEDVDAAYREEPMPAKKPKRIETIGEQVVRLIMEALTESLARKERLPDVLDDGDIPSKMNLQLYFQGFYSLPEELLEETALYLRRLRRQLLRVAKPSATEIVEVLMYDLMMAFLTRMTNLDDVRETIGHDLYDKMLSGIDMELEKCQKSYVKKLIDQIVSTAENMVNLIAKKINKMKKTSENLKKFQNRMQGWVQSFVLQETFKGDNYFIAERPVKPEEPPPARCPEEEKKKKEEELKAKLAAKYSPADLCCLGSKLKLNTESEVNFYDFFSTCRYDLKRVPREEEEEEERMPLLDLIEISRFKLRWIRKHEDRVKDSGRLCAEKKIRRWMSEVVYTPETSWLKEGIFPKDSHVYDHVEEIMYGAMTAGLLEMYYFMEEYLKLCGGKKQKLVIRTIQPEDSETQLEGKRRSGKQQDEQSGQDSDKESDEQGQDSDKESDEQGQDSDKESDEQGQDSDKESDEQGQDSDKESDEHDGVGKNEQLADDKAEETPDVVKPPCPCGHPCCKCPFDPGFKEATPPPPPPSVEGEFEAEEAEGEAEREPSTPSTVPELPPAPGQRKRKLKPCASDETLVNLKALLAEKVSLSSEEIDIKSFKWLKPYILEKGCDLKSEFAAQVHKWLDGERLSYKVFISKHSLATRASLLSLSLSLAELLKEENNLKRDVRNFIYDLWDLYFQEMFKEALLEHPPTKISEEQGMNEKPTEGGGDGQVADEDKKIMESTPNFNKDSARFSLSAVKAVQKVPEEEQIKKMTSKKIEETPEPEQTQKTTRGQSEQRQKTIRGHPEQPESTTNQPQPEPEQNEQEFEENQGTPTNEEAAENPASDLEDRATASQLPKPLPFTYDSEEGERGEGYEQPEEPAKKKKSSKVIEELVDVSSGEEIREMPPYVLPFWVKFLTELTKQALGAIARVSRLPRRLYFQSDSEVAFDEKMKEWFEFNAFNPQPTKGREIMDYIALHHKSLTNLEDTARSYLKKKKLSELLNRCTRFSSADDMADEIVADVVDIAMEKSEDNETLEVFVSNLLSSAMASSPARSQASVFEEEDDDDFNTFDTDRRENAEEEEESV